MLILLIIGLTLLIIGIVLGKKSENSDSCAMDSISILIATTALVCILSVSIIWPYCYYSNVSKIFEYNAPVETIKSAEDSGQTFENAGLIMKVAETNKNLASYRYWNNTFIGDIIPDELAALPFISLKQIKE